MFAVRTVLHPTDFSERSERAFGVACALARACGARLVVLHVAAPQAAPVVEGTFIPLVGEDLSALEEKLRQLRPTDPGVAVTHRLAQGDPAQEILQAAEDTDIGLIVLGTHGRRGLSRLLLGSVAEQVVRRAACPVVTVKALPVAEAAAEAGQAAGAAEGAAG
jgi:universal stress protein A